MCGKSNKTTSEVKFPEYLETAYRGILGAGKEAVNQPLQQYGGPRQAGFTPMQQQGFNQIAQAQGMGVPYVNAASQAFGQAGQEYNAANLGRYMDPYQQYVIDSTMANIQRSDAVAQNQLKGQGIGAGVSPGLGDRMGLAAAELERNQALARNQRIAELSSQGYTNAQNAFANDASRLQSVGQNYANLGKTAQDLTYQGIGQMLQAGQLQQQQAQTGLDQAYQQFIEQRDYPKSQVEWFANLAYGQPKPTTTTTTTPAPSLISQLAGLGTAAAGLFGAKRGGRVPSGRVPRKDYGGGIVPPMLNYEAFRAPAWTYPAFQVPTGAGVNMNSQSGWQINALPQLRWQDLGSPIITQLPKGVSDAFAGIDTSQKKKKAGGGGLAPPGEGGLSRTAEWFAKRNVPLLYAGLGMMAAESPWPLQAIGQGAATGLQAAQKSLELDANPVVDDSGPTIRIWYPSERRWEDTGVPSAKWASIEAGKSSAGLPTGYRWNADRTAAEPIPGIPAAGPDMTAAQKNAAAMGLVPGTPEYNDYITKATMPTTVSVGGMEPEYDKARGKAYAETEKMIMDNATKATSTINTLSAVEQLLDRVYTGPGAETYYDIKAWGKTLFPGLLNWDDVDDAQAVQALTNQITLELRNPSGGAGMPGAMSDNDLKFLRSMPPGLGRTPGANKLLIDYRKRLAARDIQVMEFAQQYAANHGGRIDGGFYTELAKWTAANPMFGDGDWKQRDEVAGVAAPRPGMRVGDWEFTGGDPADRKNWRKASP